MDKTKQLWLLTVLAVLAVFAGGYFVLISPQTKKAASVRRDVATVESQNRQIEAQIALLKQQAKQLPREQARLAELAKKMPNNPALPALIRSLSDAADATRASFIALKPAKPATAPGVAPTAPVTPATTSGTTTSAVNPPPPLPQLAIMPLEIDMLGTFVELKEFLASVEDLQRAFMVYGVAIKPNCLPTTGEPPPDDCDPKLLDMKLMARVFLAVPPPAPAVPVTTGTTTEGR